MRNVDPAFAAALTDARSKGIVPRKFFWMTVKDRSTGAPVEIGAWSGDYDVTLDVISGMTGLPVTRTYFGGVDLQIGEIARVSDLTIQTVSVSMSAVAPVAQQIVRVYDARLAKVEINIGLLDTASRLPVSAPVIDFLGEIDEAPIETAGVGEESRIELAVRSDAISMLRRRNPAKRSYEGQKRRGNDQWGRYANAVRTWTVPWGEGEQRQPEQKTGSSQSRQDSGFRGENR